MDGAAQVATKGPPHAIYPGRLDDKGRLKMPAAFTQYFASLPERTLYITSLDGRIARIYGIAEWREMKRYFETRPRESAKKSRSILFNAAKYGVEVEMDSQGRITFPPEIRKPLELEDKQLQLYPTLQHIQVLTPERFQEHDSEAVKVTTEDVDDVEAERWQQ